VEQAKDCLLDIVVVEFSRWSGLTREESFLASFLERPEVPAMGLFGNSEKAANDSASHPLATCQDDHRAIAIGEPTIIEVMKQSFKIAKITDCVTHRLQTYIFLEDCTHPLEGKQLSLSRRLRIAVVEFSRQCGLTREESFSPPSSNVRRYLRWVFLVIPRNLQTIPLLTPWRLAKMAIERLRSESRPS